MKKEVHRIGIGRLSGVAGLDGRDLIAQRIRKAPNDLILHVEKIGKRLVEALRPKMTAALGVDKLHVDAHAISAALDTALKDVADIQLAPDRLHVERLALVRESRIAGDHNGAPETREIGGETFRHSVDEMLLFRVAADIGERKDDDRETRRARLFWRRDRRGFGLRRLADVKRIDADRLGDVLKLFWAEIGDRRLEPPLQLAIKVLRHAEGAGCANTLQPRGDIDAGAHEVAVGLFDHVAQMRADAKFNPPVGRDARVALDHSGLHFDC